MKKKQNNSKGIVLLEAIIAIGVLVTIFTAAFSLYSTSVRGVRITNDQLVATFLAQDAMESVIAKRQYNKVHMNSWLDGIVCTNTNPCNPSVGDDLSQPLQTCGSNCSLYLVGGAYVRSGPQETQYERRVVVNTFTPPPSPPHEAEVLVTVSWDDGTTPHEYTLRYNLYADPNI